MLWEDTQFVQPLSRSRYHLKRALKLVLIALRNRHSLNVDNVADRSLLESV